MTQLQKIVAKAKTLRKSYPKLKWTDLIKKASKLVTPASKSVGGTKKKKAVKKAVVKKAVAKKKIGYKSDRIAQLIKTTPIIRKYKEKGYSRKDAIKNAMLDAGFMSGTKTHKDTKSHNVRISVVSGLSGTEHFVKQLNYLLDVKKKLESDYNIYKIRLKQMPIKDWSPFNVKHYKRLPSMIKSVNTQIREAKKHIK
jgi:hypothetical protein